MIITISLEYKKIYCKQIALLFFNYHRIKSKIHTIEIITSLQSLLLQSLHTTVYDSKTLKIQMFTLICIFMS